MKNWLLEEESGQGMVEYGLILVLVAIGVISALGLLKGQLVEVFTKIKTELENGIKAQ